MILEIKHKKLGIASTALLLVLIVLSIYLVSLTFTLLQDKIPYARLWAYVPVILMGIGVAYLFVLGYRYTLRDGTLLIERKSGERCKPIRSIPLREVQFYGEIKDAPPAQKTFRFTLRDQPLQKKVLILVQDNVLTAVHIHVDDKLHKMLDQAVNRKNQA